MFLQLKKLLQLGTYVSQKRFAEIICSPNQLLPRNTTGNDTVSVQIVLNTFETRHSWKSRDSRSRKTRGSIITIRVKVRIPEQVLKRRVAPCPVALPPAKKHRNSISTQYPVWHLTLHSERTEHAPTVCTLVTAFSHKECLLYVYVASITDLILWEFKFKIEIVNYKLTDVH